MSSGRVESRCVLVVCDYFPPSTRAGGPARSIAGIIDTETCVNTFIVITRDRDLGSSAPYTADDIQAAERDGATIRRLPRRWQFLHIWSAMRTYSTRCDSIYIN